MRKSRPISCFDRWFKPCSKCGHDSGKFGENERNKCWKCGNRLIKDYSDRALKAEFK